MAERNGWTAHDRQQPSGLECSKLAPVKYGEKVTNILEGGERPVEFAGMTEEQLRQWIVKEARALGLGEALRVEVTPTSEDTAPAATQRHLASFNDSVRARGTLKPRPCSRTCCRSPTTA